MSDLRLGAAVRAVRIRRGLRQVDVAIAAGVSPSTVSRIERGRLEEVGLSAVRAVAGALDIRVDVVARWRGGELERMLGRRHAALHEALARLFATRPEWQLMAEVSFSVYGERGIIHGLAWHPATRSLVVIELKTEIVDIQGLLGSVDRYEARSNRRRRARMQPPHDLGLGRDCGRPNQPTGPRGPCHPPEGPLSGRRSWHEEMAARSSWRRQRADIPALCSCGKR